jgi:hypothetical protein
MKKSISAAFLPVTVSATGGRAAAGGPTAVGDLTKCPDLPPTAGPGAADIADRQQTAEVGD